jgi:uncharacterized protein (TIGR03067 family)
MRLVVFLVLAALAGIRAGDSLVALSGDAKPSPKDKESLQGTWDTVSGEIGGKLLKAEEIERQAYEFRGNVFVLHVRGVVLGAVEFKLDPGKKPKQMDFLVGSNGVNPAIYKLDGDKLTICMDKPGGTRPKRFKTETGTDQKLYTFKKRRRPAPGGPPGGQPRARPDNPADKKPAPKAQDRKGPTAAQPGHSAGAASGQAPPGEAQKVRELEKALQAQKKALDETRRELAAARAEAASQLYLYRLTLARKEWQAGHLAAANQLLDECPAALRRWEWYYLRRLFHGGLLTLPGPGRVVAYSPDGKRLATAGDGATAVVWDADAGKEIRTLRGHTQMVVALQFSPDAKRLATASMDHTAKVWDLASGKVLATCAGHKDIVRTVTFNPDGKLVATGANDGTAKVWDAATGRERLSLKAHQSQVLAVVFRPDGRLLATAGNDAGPGAETLKLWDVATGRLVRTVRWDTDIITSLAFRPDGKQLAGVNYAGKVQAWDPDTGNDIRELPEQREPLLRVAYSPDGKRLATAGAESGAARLWDAHTGQELFALHGHAGAVTGLAFRPDGHRIATAGEDGKVKVWDALAAPGVVIFKHNSGKVHDMALSRDGRRLAVAAAPYKIGAGGKTSPGVNVWDTGTGRPITLPAQDWYFCTSFSPDGRRLAYAGDGSDIVVYDFRLGKVALKIQSDFFGYYTALAYSPDGKRLASGVGEPAGNMRPVNVTVWDAATGKALLTLAGHRGTVHHVAFSPDGQLLASSGSDGTVRIWDAATGKQERVIQADRLGGNPIAFSPDGKWLAVGGGVYVQQRGEVRLWDVATGALVRTLRGHRGTVLSAAFSPDGRRLASGSFDRTVKLWDPATGQEILTLQAGWGGGWHVLFSRDGNRLYASGSRDGSDIRFWDATPLPGRAE